jgi:sec-independent protein translocase protein TatA
MLDGLKGPEGIILILLVAVLFGAKRLPDAARGLGRSLRIFKAETRGLMGDDDAATTTTTAQQVTPAPVLPQPQAAPVQSVVPPLVQPVAQPVVQQPVQPVQQAPEGAEH